MTALERSPSCASNISFPMTSPRLSVHRENSSPVRDRYLNHVYDRLNGLDAQVLELRSTTLTKEGYVERRNREDQFIRREFEAQRTVTDRIDRNVTALRADVEDLKSLKPDMTSLKSDMISLKTDMNLRMSTLELFVKEANAQQTINRTCQHNSYAHRLRSHIQPVPVMNKDTKDLEWPRWFPRNVWQFWILTGRKRIERLVVLAEFYQLAGYEDWGFPHPPDAFFDSEIESSDSDDGRTHITRAEAVRCYPDEALQALAPTLGLVLSEIRKEIELEIPRPQKRKQEEVPSMSSRSKSKPAKMPCVPPTGFPMISRRAAGADDQHVASSSSPKAGTVLGYDPPKYSSGRAPSLTREEAEFLWNNDTDAYYRAITAGRIHLQDREPYIPIPPVHDPHAPSNASGRGKRSAGRPSEEWIPLSRNPDAVARVSTACSGDTEIIPTAVVEKHMMAGAEAAKEDHNTELGPDDVLIPGCGYVPASTVSPRTASQSTTTQDKKQRHKRMFGWTPGNTPSVAPTPNFGDGVSTQPCTPSARHTEEETEPEIPSEGSASAEN